MFAGRAKADSAVVGKGVSGVLQLLQIALIDRCSLTLKIRTVVAPGLRTLVPFQSEPAQSVVNGGGRGLRILRLGGVLHPPGKIFPRVIPRKEPFEQGRPRPADVQVAGRRRGKTNANGVRHGVVEYWSDG